MGAAESMILAQQLAAGALGDARPADDDTLMVDAPTEALPAADEAVDMLTAAEDVDGGVVAVACVKGIHFNPVKKMWEAYAYFRNAKCHLGMYPDEGAALEAAKQGRELLSRGVNRNTDVSALNPSVATDVLLRLLELSNSEIERYELALEVPLSVLELAADRLAGGGE
jgi:hypothetical protein